MAKMDINNLIQEILAKVNVLAVKSAEESTNSNYKPEPILKTANEIKVNTSRKIKEMRDIEKKVNESYTNGTEGRLFYEQAKFMEDYEDDYQFTGVCDRYYPTYHALSDTQLRGYFSWRTKVRKGVCEKTEIAFAFLYIYELLNNIGVKSPKEGFDKLISFWSKYRELDYTIDRYFGIWLKDYIIYYDLDPALLLVVNKEEPSFILEKLYNYTDYSPKEICAALSYFSNYNLLKSAFYKKYSTDVEAVVYKVYSELTEYYKKNRKRPLFNRFFGIANTSSYYMFSWAVFYKKDKTDRIKVINTCESYSMSLGYWQCTYYPKTGKKNKVIGELLKTIDDTMRDVYNFKHPLTLEKTTKLNTDLIKKVVNNYYLENKPMLDFAKKGKKKANEEDSARAPITIDISKFNEIRLAAEIIQDKLLIEKDKPEPTLEPVSEVKKEVVQQPESDNKFLDSIETAIVLAILESDLLKLNNLLRTNGLMLSVVIDSINEKLFDTIGDMVIELDGDVPIIIEDYLDQLKGLLNL